MKKSIIFFALILALASCKKEEVVQDEEPDTCNCGIITAESWNQQAGTFSVSIESECSGVVRQFTSDLSTYQNYSTGDRLCKNNANPW
jgi:hypothetical protein